MPRPSNPAVLRWPIGIATTIQDDGCEPNQALLDVVVVVAVVLKKTKSRRSHGDVVLLAVAELEPSDYYHLREGREEPSLGLVVLVAVASDSVTPCP